MPGEFHEAQFGYYPIANSQWLREDGTEVPVGMVVVPNPVANLTLIPSTVPISFPSPREDAPEVPVGMVPVPKTGQKPPSPRGDGTEVPVGRVPVPKTGHKPPSPRGDATGVLVGMGAVPNPVVNPTFSPSTAPISCPSPRGDATEVPVGRRAVPKTCRKTPSATPGCL